MTMHSALLAAHMGAGTIGLVLGPLAMVARKGPGAHPRLGVVYQAAIAVLAASAVGLVSLAPARLWGFAIIAVGTEAAALGGWVMARRRPPGWLPVHISLMAGSYVSLVTALLVVNWSSPLAWIVPTVIGTPWIAARASRSARTLQAA